MVSSVADTDKTDDIKDLMGESSLLSGQWFLLERKNQIMRRRRTKAQRGCLPPRHHDHPLLCRTRKRRS